MRSRREIIKKLRDLQATRHTHTHRIAATADLGSIEALLWALGVEGFDPSRCGTGFQEIADEYARKRARLASETEPAPAAIDGDPEWVESE